MGRGDVLRLAFGWGLILLLSGCAGQGGPGALFGLEAKKTRPVPALRVERPERSADYDVLMAEVAKAEGDFPQAQAAYARAALKDPDSAFIADRHARVLWRLEEMDAALRESERAFALDPEDLGVRLFLGRLYRLRRDFDGLDRVLRDADGQALDADSAAALFQVALERGDLDEAEALARQLVAMEPDQLRGVLALVSVFEQRGDFDAATAGVRGALDDFPGHFLLYMRLVQIERQRGDRPAEIAVYQEILEAHPDHFGILQRLGQAQLEENDVEGAITTYARIVERYPENMTALRRLASIEYSAGRYEAAAARLEAVLEREPGQPELAFALGQIKRAVGDDEGAARVFETIEPTAPNYADARLQIAALHELAGRAEDALAEIEALRRIRPNRPLDYHAATLRVETGDFDGGIALLESLLDGSEGDLEVLFRLGVLHGGAGDADRAVAYMQQVLAIDPDNANALNYVGYSWAERGENLEEAERLIRRALELSPEDGYITDSLGWVYYKMAEQRFADARTEEALGLLDRAQAQLMHAAELTGGDSVISEHLGDVDLLRGDKRGALVHYEEAAGLDVREEEQPNLYDKLERLRRDLGASDGGAP